MHRWMILVGSLLALVALPVGAQSTGGSFGGSNFGSSGSSGSSGSTGSGGSTGGSWGGSTGYGGGSYGGSNRRYDRAGADEGDRPSGGNRAARTEGGGRLGPGGIIGVVGFSIVFGLIVVVMIVRSARMKLPTGEHPQGGASSGSAARNRYGGPNAMYVHRLSLGIDWRSRAEVQATMKRLALAGDTASPQGLANLLRESVLALRRAEMGWLYVAGEDLGSFAPQQAEATFRQVATRMRASFQHEVVRAGDGIAHTADAPEMRAHSNEGEGTVVVHLIVVARRPLGLASQPDANQIRTALDARAALTAEQLVALEVVWSPAEDNDRMSTAELEQNYPEMTLIDPTSIAGRIFCSYCRGPFAMELLSCPHCGAPAEKSQGNTRPPGT